MSKETKREWERAREALNIGLVGESIEQTFNRKLIRCRVPTGRVLFELQSPKDAPIDKEIAKGSTFFVQVYWTYLTLFSP